MSGAREKTADAATLYAELDQLLAWFVMAKPGGSWVRWALGGTVDPDHGVARQVADWTRSGTAEARAVKSGDAYSFEIRRVPSPDVAGGAPNPSAMPDNDGAAGRMVALLAAAEAAGAARPSYREMAEALGLRDRMAARHLLARLIRTGRVPASALPGRDRRGIDSG